MENKQITMTTNGVEYVCTPKQSEQQQSEQPEQRNMFLEENEDLIRAYFMID